MWYLPSLDTSVVLIWNRRELDTDPVASQLARRVVDALAPDVTPPTLGAPRIVLDTGATVGRGRAPVVVSWSPGHDSQGSVARYQVRRRSDGGAWQAVRLSSPRPLSVALSLRVDRTAVVAVRAIDDRGNASAWMESRAIVPRWLDESAHAVQAGHGWREHAESDALGGHVLSSVTAGSLLSVQVRALAFAIVAPRSRLLSHSWLRVDDQPGVLVSAWAARRLAHQTLASRHWSATTTHTIRITVRADRHPRVEIDGLLLLEAAPVAP